MVTTAELLQKKGRHQEVGLSDAEIGNYLAAVDQWQLKDGRLIKTFQFKNYYRTIAFVNAIVYPIHTEDHHPELVITYDRCTVKFNTHSVNGGKGGISENDFILAARVDAIYQQATPQQ